MKYNFEEVMENHEPFTFYIHYSTIKGDALGKLILTDYEMIFEPLNTKLKGFINQTGGDFFENNRLQTSIHYSDMTDKIEIFPMAETTEHAEKGFDVIYYVQIGVYHTGY